MLEKKGFSHQYLAQRGGFRGGKNQSKTLFWGERDEVLKSKSVGEAVWGSLALFDKRKGSPRKEVWGGATPT